MDLILKRVSDNQSSEDQCIALQMIRACLEESTDASIVSPGVNEDESVLDFIMGDGIHVITKAILQNHTNSENVKQGLSILFCVAKETTCHWKTIWDSLGQLEGTTKLLESHQASPCIFAATLNLLTQTANCHLLEVEAKDYLRIWMPLWDLLLQGLERYQSESDIFLAFCTFLRMQQHTGIPMEMHSRICLCLTYGTRIHHNNLECRTDGEYLLTQLNDERNNLAKWQGRSSVLFKSAFVPCAAVA